ncbi:unnamed protein product [Ectocarpus sp. CCAP 1310/34]|nr:unnamed protein product [Ectocarpus sp. CCAP 1310/34]
MSFLLALLSSLSPVGDTAEIFNVNGELHLRGDQHRFDDLVNTRTDDPHDTIRGSPDGDIITYGGSMLRFSETSVIEVRTETVIISDLPGDLHLKGVTFDVRQGAGLWIIVATTTIEALEGDSAEFFTVEPQGHLGLYADRVGPLPDDGMAVRNSVVVW